QHMISLYFNLNDSPPTDLYTLSLHDALPILTPDRLEKPDPTSLNECCTNLPPQTGVRIPRQTEIMEKQNSCASRLPSPIFQRGQDRKSTRLNSSHVKISYAVFCLKKKSTYLL